MSGPGYVGRTAGTVAASYSIVVPPGFVRVPGGMDAPDAAAFVAAQLGEQPDLGTEAMVDDYARLFAGVAPSAAAELAGDFAFERCVVRQPLADLLRGSLRN